MREDRLVDARRELIVELVLRCVELVPAGRVAAYGVIGAICGVGPRQVGAIMSAHGASVPWWRIPNASGEFPPELLDRALAHWRAEGITVRADGRGCAYRAHLVDRDELALAWQRAVAALPEIGQSAPRES